MKLVFDEWYGQLAFKTRTLIRKFNVSPADYADIVNRHGCPTWDEINAFIIENSTEGYYEAPSWHRWDR